MRYLGVAGYRAKARLVTDTRQKLMDGLREVEGLHTWGDPRLGLFAYGADGLDIFAVWKRLMERGWFTGLITDPRGIHLMLSPAHAEVADDYLGDLRDAAGAVRSAGESAADTRARYA
jgi:glutamate/tyrosine decarboxylase-like PLP-dependent enzyme